TRCPSSVRPSFRFVCFPCCYSSTQQQQGSRDTFCIQTCSELLPANCRRQAPLRAGVPCFRARISQAPRLSLPSPPPSGPPLGVAALSAPSRSRSSPGRSEVPVSVPLLQHCSFPSARPGYVTRHSMALPMLCPSLSVWRRQSMISQLSIEHTKIPKKV